MLFLTPLYDSLKNSERQKCFNDLYNCSTNLNFFLLISDCGLAIKHRKYGAGLLNSKSDIGRVWLKN